MIRCAYASLFVCLLAMASWTWAAQANTDTTDRHASRGHQVSDATPMHAPSSNAVSPVIATQDDGRPVTSWLSRSGFLLAALVLMTIILIVTHHKGPQSRDNAIAAEADQPSS